MALAPDPTASTSARCPAHQRAAVATCVRCGTFLCGECTELLGEAAYCASCIAFVRAHAAPSVLLRVMLGLQLLALASIPLLMLLPLSREVVRMGGAVFLITFLLRVSTINAVAAQLGFWSTQRERRRLQQEGLAPSPWSRWVRTLAWLNLGYVVFQAIQVVWGFIHRYGVQPP